MKKLLLVFLAVMLFGMSSKAISNAAFIYSTDLTDANSFKTLLDANGFAVTLIPIANTETADFSGYDVIIISNGSWLSLEQMNSLNSKNKPIVGLGTGGGKSFDRLSLVIGYNGTGILNGNSITVHDASLTIFKAPFNLNTTNGATIQLYTTSSNVYCKVNPTGSTDGLLKVSSYYSVTRQNNKYTFWGYSLSPASMTQEGKDLFVNMLANSIVAFNNITTALPKTNSLNEATLHLNSETKQLSVSGFAGALELSLVDLSGKTVIKNQLQNQINLFGLNKGVYVVKIKSANTVISKKFIY